jgi:peptidoglycan hydrolase-like protein with peptidoglycan-binding domain
MQVQFDVAEVQGLLGVPADGELGPVTAAAIAAWKRARGLRGAGLAAAEHRRLLADVPLQAVRQMERWVGLHEVPRGSDRVPELMALAGRLGLPASLGRMGYPWCALAVFLAALAHGGETAERGLRGREFNAVYTPAILAAAKAGLAGLRVVPPALAFRGDLVLFDWDLRHGDPVDHVGRLVEIPVDGRVLTADGNSGGDGLVALRDRANGSVRAFVRDS